MCDGNEEVGQRQTCVFCSVRELFSSLLWSRGRQISSSSISFSRRCLLFQSLIELLSHTRLFSPVRMWQESEHREFRCTFWLNPEFFSPEKRIEAKSSWKMYFTWFMMKLTSNEPATLFSFRERTLTFYLFPLLLPLLLTSLCEFYTWIIHVLSSVIEQSLCSDSQEFTRHSSRSTCSQAMPPFFPAYLHLSWSETDMWEEISWSQGSAILIHSCSRGTLSSRLQAKKKKKREVSDSSFPTPYLFFSWLKGKSNTILVEIIIMGS